MSGINSMETVDIRYIFKLDENHSSEFSLQLDEKNLELIRKESEQPPEWTRLNYKQCPHCPLNENTSPYCPVALSAVSVIDKFDDVFSYDQLELEVITNDRRLSQITTAQKSISSLLGLLFAVSGCPHTSFFRPMARFHLPLSSPKETAFRATGMYLLSQYFVKQSGANAVLELDGLRTIYSNLNILNASIVKRIDSACSTDATKNAIVILDMLANMIPIVIEDHLESIQHLFDSYLETQT